jgi:hypothetical protein
VWFGLQPFVERAGEAPLDPFSVIPEMPKALSGIFWKFKDPG